MMTELQADRDSDRRIAERLGFEIATLYNGNEIDTVVFWDEKEARAGNEVPHYTTDLNAAIEHLEPTIPEHAHFHLYHPDREGKWLCEFTGKDLCIIAYSPIPSLAVCMTWWIWMDGKHD
jgi:hypothetical protein